MPEYYKEEREYLSDVRTPLVLRLLTDKQKQWRMSARR
jgi:hypothetical protein